MGLDMYLSRKIYVGGNYEHNNVKGKVNLTKGENNTPIKVDSRKITYITESCGYWRKANHIHKWFVENVQNGEDDCKEYYVEESQLKELLDLCNQIKSNPKSGSELLPTTSGFFFGSEEYDEYYMSQIIETINILEDILNDTETSYDGRERMRGEVYYQSSW